jgi:hypothetical protein
VQTPRTTSYSVAGDALASESPGSLAGTWSLEDRSSDDPVAEIDGKHGDRLGRRIVRGVSTPRTARFKRAKSRTMESRTADMKREFYRAPGDRDAGLQLSAQLLS